MKVAILTTDNREHHRKYDLATPYFGTAPESLLHGFAVLPEVEVHVLSCTQRQMHSPEKLAENIWFHSLHVPKLGWLRSGYQGCVRVVRKKLKEISPDIVHGQGTERDCAISAIFSGYPNVVTIHGNMGELARLFSARIGSYGWLAGKLEDFTLPRTHGVFCNSAYTESLVARRAARTWRVSNPIRASFFKVSGRAEKNEKPVILNIGNISLRKRQIEILEMLTSLNREGYEFEIRFIGACGDDGYARCFQKKIDEVAHLGFARYIGTMNEADLVNSMDKADALCHFPSEEAFGLVVAEALSRNLKFFGSSTGGVIDITEGVEGAELFDPDDWSSMSDGISNWITSGYPLLVSANRIIEERYYPRVIAKKHLEIYHEVLGR
jgi:glycosyltransferase involved in cell wall biosynthesis